LLYADLDHFKAYNDHYGFMRGDDVIRATATLLEELAREVTGGDAFVGHVGGDDFVIIASPKKAEELAEAIVAGFDVRASDLYDAEDRERGYIEVANRRGELQRYPLLSISIGIATTERRAFAHYAEAVAVATEMKGFTKATTGSSWAIDRRTS